MIATIGKRSHPNLILAICCVSASIRASKLQNEAHDLNGE
jgi:hypothetical protein